jgi:thioredoxin reductase (NADPH)
VLAAGDARHAAVRRVASAVGEGSVAVQYLHRRFELDDLHPRGHVRAATL